MAILAIMYVVLVIAVIYIYISTDTTISKQSKIIAQQQDVNYAQQNVIEEQEDVIKSLRQQVQDEQTVSGILYDICELHDLLQEVE